MNDRPMFQQTLNASSDTVDNREARASKASDFKSGPTWQKSRKFIPAKQRSTRAANLQFHQFAKGRIHLTRLQC
jgi:hypothetical protein